MDIKLWKSKFREYFRTHKILGLRDCDGNEIALRGGKPTWIEGSVIHDEGDMVSVDVWMAGHVGTEKMMGLDRWLRGFAASTGNFSVEVDLRNDEDGGARAHMEIPNVLSKHGKAARSCVVKDEDDFWIIGDPTIGQYMLVEDRGYSGDSCETTSDPILADHFETRSEAVDALCSQEDVILWAAGTPYPSRVRPLKVDVKVSVSAKG